MHGLFSCDDMYDAIVAPKECPVNLSMFAVLANSKSLLNLAVSSSRLPLSRQSLPSKGPKRDGTAGDL